MNLPEDKPIIELGYRSPLDEPTGPTTSQVFSGVGCAVVIFITTVVPGLIFLSTFNLGGVILAAYCFCWAAALIWWTRRLLRRKSSTQSSAEKTAIYEKVEISHVNVAAERCVMEKLVTLYRPVGQKEYELIRDSGFKSFPPRLPHQPIFYPVLTEQYAVQIARDWNTKDAASGYVGDVSRFQVCADLLARFPVQKVGSAEALEYWVPAEELDEFNRQIIGPIEFIHEFRQKNG